MSLNTAPQYALSPTPVPEPATAPPPPPAAALTVTAWRDYDPEVCAMPGMSLGERVLSGPIPEECARLWVSGARRVRLAEPVDLTATGTAEGAWRAVRQLSLVRDLTARAVLVEWRLRPADSGRDPGRDPDDRGDDADTADPADAASDADRDSGRGGEGDGDGWKALGHLQPPNALPGLSARAEAERLRAWRAGHYVGLCLWRQGPGFVQIRDRRWGSLARFTVDEPHYQEAVNRLAYGATAADVPADALSDFTAERLVLPVGELNWWAPYRVRRWSRGGIIV